MKSQNGKFITIEGMDGAGKSTIISMLKVYLEENNLVDKFVFTREPGSAFSKEAEKIRNLILDNQNSFSQMVDALLFATSRRLNLEKGIWPAIESGKHVISDRYWHSSFVYQGILGEVGLQTVKQLNEIATNNTKPDFVIFLDLEPQTSVERLTHLRTSMDRLEHTDIKYYENLKEAYLNVINDDPQQFRIIDAKCDINELFQRVLNVLKQEGVLN
ncbi:Thymidylate kinase [Metamycoplasma cloacale]|uniref:Thymidylate kinase n=1 Tax=Metamycoplasma cloacale TaxID=92401 RepID=A0A2Z4LMM8_9BACT|nr:dTMP kinase [Metamycoplasma cloacale]AWX42914.1 dTMP kinase [Metamycoplasma cloacale]VEU79262.1 Thymidylate kinase [Metamycoplasma cloacale]